MEECLNFLSSGFELFSKDVSSSKGHGLVVLRLCNEMIRRCPKSSSSDQIGFVLIVLSKLFPLGERSGVNLRGDLNIDNVTLFEELDDGHLNDDKIFGTTFRFYREFWRLQNNYLHPTMVLQKMEWRSFVEVCSFSELYLYLLIRRSWMCCNYSKIFGPSPMKIVLMFYTVLNSFRPVGYSRFSWQTSNSVRLYCFNWKCFYNISEQVPL